jgi:hypothetical protein
MSAPVEGKKKRGKPSDIKGARHEFLQGHLDGYNTASAKKKTRQFWTKVFVPYWAAFPWRLPLDQDSDRANPFDYALAPRTPAEEEEKRKVIAETEAVSRVKDIFGNDVLTTEQKLKLWFCRQAKGGGGKDNPWAAWLKRLRTPTTAAPKRLSDWQFYMQHDDFKDRVTAAYEIRKEGVAEKDLLNKRGEVARELLAAEPQEVRNRILREIEEEHAALREKHEDAVEGLPAIDEEGREE